MVGVTNKLRVCHFPQIPCEPFIVEVDDEKQAYVVSEALANQHLFLFEKKMIPDYSNVIVVEMFEEDSDGDGNPDWSTYFNEEEGMEWEEIVSTYFEAD